MVPSMRQGSTLLYAESYLLKKKKTHKSGKQYFVCYDPGCSASTLVEVGVELCSRPKNAHNHPEQSGLKEELTLKAAIKARCVNESGEARAIFDEEICK